VDFLLPDIGEGLTEAEIVRWLVAEGETVELDQPIVEIETDKALMEIPTPFAGVLVAHGAAEGTVLAVGDVLVTIQTVDEFGTDRDESVPPAEPAPIVGTLSEEAVDLTPRTDGADAVTGESTVQALPIVRKLAGDLGVDLATVTGTGLDGQITRDDVRAAASGGEGQGETATPADQQPELIVAADEPAAQHETPAAPEPGETVALSKMRRTIAERVSASWREIPHVTTFAAADVTRLMASRTALKRRRNAPVSIDAMLVKAVVTALGRHRVLAARLENDSLVYPKRTDIGVAVDTNDGLMVVVVEEPGRRDLVELSAEIARLSERARTRALPTSALGGQSFTVSNIGAVGGGYGTPIVPLGTTSILSVGRASETPVARNGRLEIAPMMPLSLSYDHRVIDGAEGRRFLATVVENLEEPTLFLA
jgi:pyruvate dehydrogenase E2 component (dihydrolipoamide acetyltransferase)